MADKLRIVRGWIKGYAAHSAQFVTTTDHIRPLFFNQTVFVVGSPVVVVIVVAGGVGVTGN